MLRKKCVEHWFKNLMLLQLNHYSGSTLTYQINHQGNECAFCAKYQTKHKASCLDCPIYEKTDNRFCLDTPWRKINTMMAGSLYTAKYSYEEFFAAFAAEIDFLLSL
jgi:hypothetical protein